MHIIECRLTLHEPLFFATREIGRLYEAGRYLHNYALTYAFGLALSPWFHREQVPHYAEDLLPLRDKIYVTPAAPERSTFQLTTFKYGEEILHVEMRQAERNTPSFGRAKELAPESRFVCYVLSAEPLQLPRWIRLGKWHSKTLVETTVLDVKERDGSYTAACPLNPLDVPANMLRAFDMISMPPASIVANARCAGPHYALPGGRGLPVGMQYTFPKG
ncbi:MAG: type I-D CRISPR-associated protein Cas5/Csc1 [Oscillochloris sp.]|nr:type I-D CRISPR-associated protein Cas5/Csc1 [Oscillochloris sp.]